MMIRGIAKRAASAAKNATKGQARLFSSLGPHNRVHNFNAGPGALPVSVLEEAQKDLLNWKGSGMSVMEMSHRSKEFDSIAIRATEDLRELLKVPDTHTIMWMQGGASGQFAAVPLNFMGEGGTADHLVTGSWSKKAAEEGTKYGSANVVASGKEGNFTSIPDPKTWKLTEGASYFSYCANETVHGVEYPGVPDVGSVPLVADMSSNFLSRPVDVSKFGVIYAGAQKNVAPSGVTVVIVRKDLLDNAHVLPVCPTIMNYQITNKNDSMYNTPPCWTIYMAGLTMQHLKREGGLQAQFERNKDKASLLYDCIDKSNFYASPVNPAHRSMMNVPFRVGKGKIGDEAMEKKFISEATALGFEGLKGHRSVGGCRASIYNSVSFDAVLGLTKFMHAFEKENHK